MELLLNFLHTGDGSYDLYLSSAYQNPVYALLIHGVDRQVFYNNQATDPYSMYGYVKLAEGDTWEFHQPTTTSGDYIKTVYTAASGTITAVEHGTTTTIVAAS
jgi:hypothetical protein